MSRHLFQAIAFPESLDGADSGTLLPADFDKLPDVIGSDFRFDRDGFLELFGIQIDDPRYRRLDGSL